jgi:hypothetical protein
VRRCGQRLLGEPVGGLGRRLVVVLVLRTRKSDRRSSRRTVSIGTREVLVYFKLSEAREEE